MVAVQQVVEQEIGLVLDMMSASADDWYAVVEGDGLSGNDREKFNQAFESLKTGAYDLAFKGFGELSAKGSLVSQYYLGLMYLKGMGSLQDYSRAHLWFNIASSQGHKRSRIRLDELTQRMSANQVAHAQKLAQAWAKRHVKKDN